MRDLPAGSAAVGRQVTDVLIATMAFPAASEAFAGVEVRSLLAHGVHVRVRALRVANKLADSLLPDWRLTDLDVTHWSIRSLARGILAMLRRPTEMFWASAWLCRNAWRSPRLALRCAVFLPRMFDILDECELMPPSVLHVFWGHYPAVLAALVKRRMPGVHVSMSLGAYDLVYGFGPSIGAANMADTVWTHAQCNVASIRASGVYNPRLEILRRGLDFTEVPLSFPDRIPGRVVTVARLEKNKGVDDVIRAFAAARARLPHLQLVIIGEGPDRRRLERLASDLNLKDCLRFTGAATHGTVFSELAMADVFMLLSRSPSERLPNSLKEAMACRCVCITTRTPGIEELRAHVDNPLVVEQGDWRLAARRLEEVVSEPDRFAQAREAGSALLFRDFDSRVLAARRIAVWAERAPTESSPRQEAL